MHCYCIKLCIRVIFLGRVGIPCRSRWPTNVLYGSGHHSLCFCLSATSCSWNGNKSPQPGNDKHCDVHYVFSAVFSLWDVSYSITLLSSCCPSVLWHCRLGIIMSIQPVKNWVMRCWCGYLSGARCTLLAYGPADASYSVWVVVPTQIECWVKNTTKWNIAKLFRSCRFMLVTCSVWALWAIRIKPMLFPEQRPKEAS